MQRIGDTTVLYDFGSTFGSRVSESLYVCDAVTGLHSLTKLLTVVLLTTCNRAYLQ